MTARRVSSTAQLLRASSDDEIALTFPLPDSGFGFHAQQSVEKLYKTLITSRTGDHPHIHDLKSLRQKVEALSFLLPTCDFNLERLSEYAGDARYDDPIPLDEQERSLLRTCIADLRAYVHTQLPENDTPAAETSSQANGEPDAKDR